MKQLTTEIIIISIYRKGVKKMQKVLIAGATGYLGRFVVQEFKKRG